MTDQATVPRSQQLLVTIFGLYARGEGDALPVASIVRMLGELGIEPAGVRSSVSRLKRRGVLENRRENGVSKYAIAPNSLHIFAEGDARIYHPTRAGVGDSWLMAIFSVPESQREKRHVLRSELTRLGFGVVTSGVWIAPIKIREQSQERIMRLGLDRYVTFFNSDYLEPGELAVKISEWWDLESLQSLYADFVDRHAGMLRRWQAELRDSDESPVPGDRERAAFVDYIPMFTRWRHLPYLDPGLPLELLPRDWNGQIAGHLFAELHQLIRPRAHRHVVQLINSR